MTSALRVAYPRHCPPSAGPGEPDFEVLAPFGRDVHFVRDEGVFSEGDSTDCFYRVVSGMARICKYTRDGRRHILDFKVPGDVLGLGNRERHASGAEAVTGLVLTAFPRHQLRRQVSLLPVLQDRLVDHLSDSLSLAEHYLLILGSQDAKERMAAFLLRMAARIGLDAKHRLQLPMCRQDIADHLGLTIESVCRSLSLFKARGILAVPNSREVILNNLPALKALAETY